MARPTAKSAQRVAEAVHRGLGGSKSSGFRQLYGLVLLLLAVLFFTLTFQGRPPRVLERVFQAPGVVDDAAAQARRAEVAGRMGGAFYDPADGAPFAETAGYRRLLQQLIDHVRPGDVVTDPPLFDRDLAMRMPDLQRGEVVKVRGIVAGYWAHKLDQPVFQLQDVWRVFLTDTEGEDGVVIDVIDRPPALEERREVVEMAATFYRLVAYETKAAASIAVPYLLARTLTLVPEEERSLFDGSNPGAVVLLMAIAIMVVWGVARVITSRPKRPSVRWRAPHPI